MVNFSEYLLTVPRAKHGKCVIIAHILCFPRHMFVKLKNYSVWSTGASPVVQYVFPTPEPYLQDIL